MGRSGGSSGASASAKATGGSGKRKGQTAPNKKKAQQPKKQLSAPSGKKAAATASAKGKTKKNAKAKTKSNAAATTSKKRASNKSGNSNNSNNQSKKNRKRKRESTASGADANTDHHQNNTNSKTKKQKKSSLYGPLTSFFSSTGSGGPTPPPQKKVQQQSKKGGKNNKRKEASTDKKQQVGGPAASKTVPWLLRENDAAEQRDCHGSASSSQHPLRTASAAAGSALVVVSGESSMSGEEEGVGEEVPLLPSPSSRQPPPAAKAMMDVLLGCGESCTIGRNGKNAAAAADPSNLAALDALDDELCAFARYVRLTPAEVQVRTKFVNLLQETARSLFSGGGNSGNGSNCWGSGGSAAAPSGNVSISTGAARLQVFGSFSALSVCAYHSDVDVALWGVVDGGGTAAGRPPRRDEREHRRTCVQALWKLERKLRKKNSAIPVQDTQLIRNARVPIIKLKSGFGFEADVAVSGMNGADTSKYASRQAGRFKSFAPVVVYLKILLYQHKLDVPFNGGLGSYKLYVLVSYAIERHLELGGRDRPGEILLSFLYRYGVSAGGGRGNSNKRKKKKFCHPNINASLSGLLRTTLNIDTPVECRSSNAIADLSNVFQLDSCVELFDSCWALLTRKLRVLSERCRREQNGDSISQFSLLGELIKSAQLSKERHKAILIAKDCLVSAASPPSSVSSPPRFQQQQTRPLIRRLPTHGIPATLLERIDDELAAFANYVRLQPVEEYARRQFVSNLARASSQSAFASCKDAKGADNDENKSCHIRLDAIGSFAALPLCTFGCVLDLVLSGQAARDFSSNPTTGTPPAPPRSPADKQEKQDRISRWREALARVDSGVDSKSGEADDEASRFSARKEEEREAPKSNDKATEKTAASPQSEVSDSAARDSDSDDTADQLAPLKKSEDDAHASARGDDESVENLKFLLDGQFDDAPNDPAWSRATARPRSPTTEALESGYESSEEDEDIDEEGDCGIFADADEGLRYSRYRDHRDSIDEAGIEVSVVAAHAARRQVSLRLGGEDRHPRSIGTSSSLRRQVDALNAVGRELRTASLVRSNPRLLNASRVPALCVDSSEGVIAEIVVQDDIDDNEEVGMISDFVAEKVGKYNSFAPVVLFLQVLLSQRRLHRQSSGGIPSQTLHLLVLYHIQCHIELQGGSDRPGEVLLSFLFRYGATFASFTGEAIEDLARTDLARDEPLPLAFVGVGGERCTAEIDLSHVAMLESCIGLFHSCWEGMLDRLRTAASTAADEQDASSSAFAGTILFGGSDDNGKANLVNGGEHWLLGALIDAERLHEDRHEALERAQHCYDKSRKQQQR